MSETKKAPSPSHTYVIPLEIDGFTHFRFKKFTLPEKLENTCEFATWYFYNHLDGFSCGLSAFSYEDYCDLVEI